MTEGDRLRDEGMSRVWDSHDPQWRAMGLAMVKEVAAQFDFFTSNKVLHRLEQIGYAPRDARAMGPLMRRAQALDWIEPTDRTPKSERASRHSGTQRVWRSKLR